MKYLVVAALFAAAPLYAQGTGESTEPYDAASKSNEELLDKADDDSDPWVQRPCDLGVPLFTELARRVPEDGYPARGLLFAGALCDDENDDYAAGYAKIRELEARWPEYDFNDVGFYFAYRTENAADYIARLRASSDGQLGKLTSGRFWPARRMINQQGLEGDFRKLMLEWADQKRIVHLPFELQAGVTATAMRAAVAEGRNEMVPGLLVDIRSPMSYIDFLADRELESIWPLLEERVGPNFDRIADEYAFWATGRLENHPRDRDRFSEAAHSLHFAGRFEEAIALARQWRERDGAMSVIEEGDAWALNIEAYAHDALGERTQADAVFDQLAALEPEKHPWVVNFVINRASRLVGQERWQEGLEASGLARGVAEKWGSTYAKMIIARDHACALNALGRTGEIEAELQFLRDNRETSYEIASQGLLCVGRREEAAAFLLEGIGDERFRSNALEALQSDDFELFYTASKLPEPTGLLDESPELKEAFDRYARAIPEEFIPTATLRAKR